MLKLDLIHTVAFSGIVLFIGYGLRKFIKPLARYNIPAPVVGGLLVALAALVAHRSGVTLFAFDLTLRDPLMIAFFTSIGFGASLSLLRTGGPQVAVFFGVAAVFAVLQNILGILVAVPFGLHPLFGVLSGSVTLTGGPATGLAFAPLFESAGVSGASTIAVAAAMFGIISGGLVGGPVGTLLIERRKLKVPAPGGREAAPEAAPFKNPSEPEEMDFAPTGLDDEDKSAQVLLKSVVIILAAMWAGSWLSRLFTALHFTLPAYIGAMFVAAVLRNIDDRTGWLGLSQGVIDDLGHAALSLFLVIALMTLRLWELAGMVVPLLVILVGQVVLVAAACAWPLFRLMGRDYESAVMCGGFVGFMMGTTANAMANMKSLVERYGRAPRAFLVVPMVGAFFIDFANALIITVFLNVFK